MGEQTFLYGKPYEFIPFLEKPEVEKYSSHNKVAENTYSGKLKLRITTLSPLHIGSKQQDYDQTGNVLKKQIRRNGNLIIPGSSLKGAVRSIAEAISYSCAAESPFQELKSLLPRENRVACSNIHQRGLCMACSIFGMANNKEGYKGKVAFGEFAWKKGNLSRQMIPVLESPFKNYPDNHDVFGSSDKSHYGNERLYYCKACEAGDCQTCSKEKFFQCKERAGRKREMGFRGRKFYSTGREISPESVREDGKENCFEMVDSESVFEGELVFQNLKKEEGKLLSYALDIGHHFTMKLGYGKPLGYGKIKVDLIGAESMESRYGLQGMKMHKDVENGWSMERQNALQERKNCGNYINMVTNWAEEYRKDSPEEIKAAITELERIMEKQAD